MALLVVLLLISITLGLSYAAMRSQHTAIQIHQNYELNSDRRSAARLAAVTGMMMAVQRMHTTDWDGVDVPWGRPLGEYEGFQVTYATGDPAFRVPDEIDWENPDYNDPYYDFPYRVTLESTGYAADPHNPARTAKHRVRAVVRLVPRALADEPASWSGMMDYTIFQWKEGFFGVNVPCHIEGPVRIQQWFDLSGFYPWSWSPRARYLADLERMRQAGYPDWRLFNGPVDLPYAKQSWGVISLMNGGMGVSTNDVPKEEAKDWNHPDTVTTYQIYPGGRLYAAEVLPEDHYDVVRRPDPQTNPLGIYCRKERARLYGNTTFRGTLVTSGDSGADVEVYGTNVKLLRLDLPPLAGTDVPVRLATVISADDVRFYAGARVSVEGMVTAMDDFEIRPDHQEDMTVTIQGRIVAKEIYVYGRSDWYKDEHWWQDQYEEFDDQKTHADGIPFFPLWVNRKEWGADLDPNPKLSIKPAPTPARYYWHNLHDPLYVPHADDAGLRWRFVQWTENP